MSRQTSARNQPGSFKTKQDSKARRTTWWSKFLFVISIFFTIFLLGVMVTGLVTVSPFWLWLVLTAIMIALLVALGLRVKQHLLGILIDARNRISLSRFQIILWTILVLSAFLAIALPRSLPGGTEQPLNISFPTELLAALGISTASLAGSSFVKNNKKTKDPRLVVELQGKVDQAQAEMTTKEQRLSQITSEAAGQWAALKAQNVKPAEAEFISQSLRGQVEQARAELGQAEENLQAKQHSLSAFQEVSRQGLIKTNYAPAEASLMDIFQGDEVGNFDQVDLSKVQMFLLTAVVLIAYSAALYDLLLDQSAVFNPLGVSLPVFSASVSTLLAISHGGYLAVKAVDHS